MTSLIFFITRLPLFLRMTDNSIYGSTRELMSASDYVEKGGVGGLGGGEAIINSSLKRKPGVNFTNIFKSSVFVYRIF